MDENFSGKIDISSVKEKLKNLGNEKKFEEIKGSVLNKICIKNI